MNELSNGEQDDNSFLNLDARNYPEYAKSLTGMSLNELNFALASIEEALPKTQSAFFPREPLTVPENLRNIISRELEALLAKRDLVFTEINRRARTPL